MMVKVSMKDNGAGLRNPGMGWFLAYYTDNADAGFGEGLKDSDTLDWFPGCSGVSFRIGWGRVEPKEGQFDWNYTDRIAQRWIEAGRQIGLNWIAFSTTGTPPATPLWVKDKGAQGWMYSGNNHWTPNWDDATYLRTLEDFLKEAGRRYDGKPYVAFVEVGSLGTWGEGHSWTPKGDMPAISNDAKKRHLELWRKYFPKTPLFLNYAYMLNNPQGQEIFDFAKRLGYSLADWSMMIPTRSIEPSVHLAQQIERDRPILLEHHHYGDAVNQGWWGDGENLYRAVEKFHASMMRIHWYPKEFLNGNGKELKGNKELVDRINRRIGYRLQIVDAQWPDSVRPGAMAEFVVRLRNNGVAPCYKGGFAAITLKDGAKIVASGVNARDSVRSLETADTAEKASVREFRISVPTPRVASGKYAVHLSVGEANGKPIYALPHDNDDSERRYKLGDLTVKG